MRHLVGVGECLEQASFLDGEPMECSEVWHDVCEAGMVEDQSGCGVVDDLELVRKVGGDTEVEGVVVVQPACDQGLGDSLSGVQRKPFEDLSEHAVDVIAARWRQC